MDDVITFEKVIFSSPNGEMFEIQVGLKMGRHQLVEMCQNIIDDLWYLEDEKPTAVVVPLFPLL